LRVQAGHPILWAMDPDDLSARIGAAEDDIETLAEAISRSRRIVLLSRGAALAGGAWFLSSAIGLLPLDAAGLVFAIALGLGGIVSAGSSLGTIRETEARLVRVQALRDALIDRVSTLDVAHSGAAAPPRLSASPAR
jgi:hypothetical protein